MAAVNGVRLHYALYGRGEPLILLHGGSGQGDHWALQIPAFMTRYQVLTIDSRGHGRSTLGTEPLSYRQMADDLVALMDQLQISKASIVGWSDGGIIGLDLAIRHPERLVRLVAFGANYRTDGARAEPLDSPTGPAWAELSTREYAALSPTPDKFDAFRQALGAMYANQPNYSDAQLRAIHTPTLISAGYYDEYYELDHTIAMARLIPGAQLAILPNASHFGIWQVPQVFNQMVLDFLAQ
ncbi:alpha/beta fold hydrolase [Steroidobacter sp.]|uniref:alpha/beta fold hydrolase n=1 Tax=Steroidobacter sp. TaxID=1978227 RepID=UPI001A44D124|nr:alpha/beta hydrolase [Steroidobacter sp.]MBL8266804.1 alpha/beta fold hydrolase [Steroidobacter sp.]